MAVGRRTALLLAVFVAAMAAVAGVSAVGRGDASVPVAHCLRHPHRIALNSLWAEQASQAYPTLLMWNTGKTSCLLRVRTGIQFRDLHGRQLAVRRVRLDPAGFRRVVPAHGYVYVTWDWSNWCGPQRRVAYRFRLGQVRLERRAAPPPCFVPGRPSKVGLAYVGVVSP